SVGVQAQHYRLRPREAGSGHECLHYLQGGFFRITFQWSQFLLDLLVHLPAYSALLLSYKLSVNTSTDRADFQYGQFSVIRRFKDFVWLTQRLEEEFPGIVMPALPVKMNLGKFDQVFIEKRRKELEKFLNRVAGHDELSSSQYFKTFLQADDAGLADTKDKHKAEQAPVGARHVLKWWGEAVTHVKTHVDK
ncbi:unnamed protein product, partial [Choristocarpus tenellus]